MEITILLISCGLLYTTMADCPDATFRCPTGEKFTIGTCWNSNKAACLTCRSITDEMKSKCRKYSCSGSTSNWYGRNDGCSAGQFKENMTEIFRAACAIHDLCYATPKRTKEQCDDDFLANMYTTCEFLGIGLFMYPFCRGGAKIAYEVVKERGNNFPDFARSCREV